MLLNELSVLVEKRRNPKMNPRYSPEDQLQQLSQKLGGAIDNVFVTFTQVDKLGTNPQSGYYTPMGIYAYPLQYVLDQNMDVPYAGEAKYIQVFKVQELTNVWTVSDESQFEEMKRKLKITEPKMLQH